MAEKVSKAEADYRAARNHKTCGVCSMFIKPEKGDLYGRCTAVTGQIYASDTCKFWEHK